jgi:hypothetical protein
MGALGLMAGGAAGGRCRRPRAAGRGGARNGERLGRLIDDILDLTKLEGDRLALHLRPQSVAPLLRECIAANQGYAQRAGVVLSLELPAEAPRPRWQLDADRFLQVMANLLSNAIKHSPQGETVRVWARSGAEGCASRCTTAAPGIAPAFRARMFEKFSQADGTDRRAQGGTGSGCTSRACWSSAWAGASVPTRWTVRLGLQRALPACRCRGAVARRAAARGQRLPGLARACRWLAGAFSVEGVATLAQAEGAAAIRRRN